MTSWRGYCDVDFVVRRELSVTNEDQNEGSVSNFVAGCSPTVIWDVSRTAKVIDAGVKATRPLGLGHWVSADDGLAGIGLGYTTRENEGDSEFRNM